MAAGKPWAEVLDECPQHAVATESEPRRFAVCVAGEPEQCDPRAHGGIVVEQRCACGAVRLVARNMGYVEYGPWRQKEVTQ